jgi:hypothetical protein
MQNVDVSLGSPSALALVAQVGYGVPIFAVHDCQVIQVQTVGAA